MPYTIEHITGILGADGVLAHPAMIIGQLSTDSRRITFPQSTLFFALRSGKRDGHAFIREVYERGVRNFIVNKGYKPPYADANFVMVGDTLDALQTLAAYHRSLFRYPVIGITGSNGKTIVKEWLNQLLAPDYHIVRSPRSYNSQIGVPLSVWQMQSDHTLALFEAGISMPGEMSRLETIIRPTIGVFTNLGEAHGENFSGPPEKAAEKATLFRHSDIVIHSADDEIICTAISRLVKPSFTWSRTGKGNVNITEIEKSTLHTTIRYRSGDTAGTLLVPFTDDASVQNACTCLAVLRYLGLQPGTIEARMRNLQSVNMRLQLVHGINNCIVVNDSYSFDVSSFSIALDFLMQQQQPSEKTVILSDIPSAKTPETYEAVIAMLHARKIHRVITIGEEWKRQEALVKDIPVTQHYDDTAGFIRLFNSNQFRNETILLKGARVFGFEKIVSLLERKVHQTVMEINLTAMAHNLDQYRRRLNTGVKIMAMVKAFAYGSGSIEVANLLQFHKVDYLAVAYADEGVDLRKAGIGLPVMVMNADEAAFESIVQNNLEPELFSHGILRSFRDFLRREGMHQYPVHLKLDTGMHRLGFESHDLPQLPPLLAGNTEIAVRSVFTHLAASEDPGEDAFTTRQSQVFEKCCHDIRKALGYDFIRHVSNSAAVFRNPALQYDMVRLGIGLYGVDSSGGFQEELRTVANLKTTIAQLRRVKKGDTVGYNRRHTVERDSLIATIRIGYADGFRRNLGWGNGKVCLKGIFAPVIGTVSMDMTMVDVTNVPDVQEGDEVEIFGVNIPVQQFAGWSDTIPYEILATVNQRVKRIYIEE